MIGTSGITRFRARAASRPFITGIERSSRIKSGATPEPPQLPPFRSPPLRKFQSLLRRQRVHKASAEQRYCHPRLERISPSLASGREVRVLDHPHHLSEVWDAKKTQRFW